MVNLGLQALTLRALQVCVLLPPAPDSAAEKHTNSLCLPRLKLRARASMGRGLGSTHLRLLDPCECSLRPSFSAAAWFCTWMPSNSCVCRLRVVFSRFVELSGVLDACGTCYLIDDCRWVSPQVLLLAFTFACMHHTHTSRHKLTSSKHLASLSRAKRLEAFKESIGMCGCLQCCRHALAGQLERRAGRLKAPSCRGRIVPASSLIEHNGWQSQWCCPGACNRVTHGFLRF